MNDQRRAKILAAVLAAVVVVYWGRSVVTNAVLAPIRRAQQQAATAARKLEELSVREIRLGADRRNLADWRQLSLPEDPLVAQRVYREWVENLARHCGFRDLVAAPGSRSEQKGRFVAVPVEVKAETDLQGLSRFLHLFDQAAILQRVAELKITSSGSQGNPRLTIVLKAEGLSLFRAGARQDLFPRTSLAAEVTESTAEVRVESSDGFPVGEVFVARIERELIRVTEVRKQVWSIARGIHGTQATAHPNGAVAELLPLRPELRDKDFDEYAAFLAASPFAIPTPPKTWNPRLLGVSDRKSAPGEEIRLAIRADGLNPDTGAPQFSLENAPAGMTIDPTGGELVWQTDPQLTPGEYTATVILSQSGQPDLRVQSVLKVTLALPNAAPVLTLPEKAVVILGQKFQLLPVVSDDGPSSQLNFSIEGEGPSGLQINSQTGQLTWTPAQSFRPGTFPVEIRVTDAGSEPKSTSRKISLEVQDDSAILTMFTGTVAKDDVREAWFRNKGTGEVMQLKVGQKLRAAEIEAEVVSIGERNLTLRDEKGLWSLKLSARASLRDRVLVEPSDPVAPSDPAAPSAPQR